MRRHLRHCAPHERRPRQKWRTESGEKMNRAAWPAIVAPFDAGPSRSGRSPAARFCAFADRSPPRHSRSPEHIHGVPGTRRIEGTKFVSLRDVTQSRQQFSAFAHHQKSSRPGPVPQSLGGSVCALRLRACANVGVSGRLAPVRRPSRRRRLRRHCIPARPCLANLSGTATAGAAMSGPRYPLAEARTGLPAAIRRRRG